MLLGGEDSTAATMAWMFHFLTEHPDIQARAQAEVDEVLGKGDMLTDYRDHERLPYVEAVAFETMRLKSVFPVLFLGTNQDVELGGVQIPGRHGYFPAHPAMRDAEGGLRVAARIPAGTLVGISRWYTGGAQYQSVRSIRRRSAVLSWTKLGAPGDQSRHGDALPKLLDLQASERQPSRRADSAF